MRAERFTIMLLVPLILSYSNLRSQSILDFSTKKEEKRYQRITASAKYIPSAITTSITNLAYHLTSDAHNDLEKIRAIFVWVSHNIAYDIHSFINDRVPPQDPELILRTRTAVCQGYANLINALCQEANVEGALISGYSKGFGYEKGQRFDVSNHVWNSVKIDSNWYLLDATWAATKTNMPHRYEGNKDPDHYFLSDPKDFVLNHLPEDPMWQFLNNPVPIDIFEQEEQQITNYLNSSQNSFNYLDSLATWEQLSLAERRKISYQRSSAFNPRNKKARFQLGIAVFYQALDSMNILHDITLEEIDSRIPTLEMTVFTMLDEAAFHFASASQSNTYQQASEFLEEVTYQKGVFKYEAGQRIYDLLIGLEGDQLKQYHQPLAALINRYYDEAIQYFNLIDPESRYYEDAVEYVTVYIKEYRPR